MTQQINEPLEFLNGDDNVTIKVDNQSADVTLGGGGMDGDIFVRDSQDRTSVHINGNAAKIQLGAVGNEGDIAVRDNQGRDVFIVSGHYATCYLGADGNEGDLFIRDGAGRNVFTVNAHQAQVTAGTQGNPARLRLTDKAGQHAIHMDAEYAAVYIGARGNEGDLRILDGTGREALSFDAQYALLYVGTTNNEGDIRIRNNAGQDTIRLDGQSGDIELLGADCAEEFFTIEAAAPGTLMVINADGLLEPCTRAYDTCVAGVVSGAGGFAPGVTLDKRRGIAGRQALSLVGKVFVWVDADQGPVTVGDLLTSSPTRGHAMRAVERDRAFGAVIGKALGALAQGRALVPMLVSLQ